MIWMFKSRELRRYRKARRLLSEAGLLDRQMEIALSRYVGDALMADLKRKIK